MRQRSQDLLVWRFKRGLRELGWSGVAGVVMLLFAAGYYFSTYAPLQDEVELQKQAFESASAELKRSGRDEEAGTPRRQLTEFYSRLKSQADVPEVVRGLHRSADAAGLRYARGDYRPQRDASGKMLRYQITLPVRGTYPEVRRFLAQALREEPALALDGVGFQTDQSGGGLETRVQFTLFVRANEFRSTFDGANESRSTFERANGSRSAFDGADGERLTSVGAHG